MRCRQIGGIALLAGVLVWCLRAGQVLGDDFSAVSPLYSPWVPPTTAPDLRAFEACALVCIEEHGGPSKAGACIVDRCRHLRPGASPGVGDEFSAVKVPSASAAPAPLSSCGGAGWVSAGLWQGRYPLYQRAGRYCVEGWPGG